jgi:hypothetical protein
VVVAVVEVSWREKGRVEGKMGAAMDVDCADGTRPDLVSELGCGGDEPNCVTGSTRPEKERGGCKFGTFGIRDGGCEVRSDMVNDAPPPPSFPADSFRPCPLLGDGDLSASSESGDGVVWLVQSDPVPSQCDPSDKEYRFLLCEGSEGRESSDDDTDCDAEPEDDDEDEGDADDSPGFDAPDEGRR